MTAILSCRHPQTTSDMESGEKICIACGTVVGVVLEVEAPKAPNDHSAIVSPGMIHALGGDTDIKELNQAKVLNGALKDLYDGVDNKSFWIVLGQQLKDRGYSETDIALRSALLRREWSKKKAEQWRDLRDSVRQALGVDV